MTGTSIFACLAGVRMAHPLKTERVSDTRRIASRPHHRHAATRIGARPAIAERSSRAPCLTTPRTRHAPPLVYEPLSTSQRLGTRIPDTRAATLHSIPVALVPRLSLPVRDSYLSRAATTTRHVRRSAFSPSIPPSFISFTHFRTHVAHGHAPYLIYRSLSSSFHHSTKTPVKEKYLSEFIAHSFPAQGLSPPCERISF